MIMQLPFKIEWISYARVDVAIKFPETLQLMIDSGARGLFFGLESFNDKAARGAGKGMPSQKVKEFLIEFKNKFSDQCLVNACFICGLPGETIESQKATFDWVCENNVIDFAFFNALVLDYYEKEMDGVFYDYAEYSRNPEKYGFRNVKFSGDTQYWEHDTMNRHQAEELAYEGMVQWWNHGKDTYMDSIWSYTIMKSLGFQWKEITQMSRNPLQKSYWEERTKGLFEKHLEKYWEKLAINNQISSNHKLHRSLEL